MLDTLVRLLLSPILVAQALGVRRKAQSLPEARGPRKSTAGAGPSLKLRIIGDSSAAGVGVNHQNDALAGQLSHNLHPHFRLMWTLDATSGATTKSTLTRLESASPISTNIVIIALGVNDVTRLVPARMWVKQQHSLFARINQLYQPDHIYLSGMPPFEHFPLLPNPLRWALARHAKKLEKRLVRSLYGQTQITYVPFSIAPSGELIASDGFHPSYALYTLWAKEMANRIISDWPKSS